MDVVQCEIRQTLSILPVQSQVAASNVTYMGVQFENCLNEDVNQLRTVVHACLR